MFKLFVLLTLAFSSTTFAANQCFNDSDCSPGSECYRCWGPAPCFTCVESEKAVESICDDGEVLCRTNWGRVYYCAQECE